MKKFFSRILCGFCALVSHPLSAQNVWTQHNDQGRTGWYPYETTLNINNVNKNTFGIFYDHITDDKIVGQPLVIMNVNIPNVGFKNVVFVTTLNNTVYAFDADVNDEPYWVRNFTSKIAAAPGADCTNCRPASSSDIHPSLCGGSYGDFSGNMGIVGSPVIDSVAGTMYFVTKIVNQNDGTIDNHAFVSGINDEYNYTTTGFHQYLHAIDITTGFERPNSPVEITATSTGTGDGQTTTNSGIIHFNPRTQFNRAGLVLSNGIVYIAFAAHCDFNPSHGWIIGYNANTLTPYAAYNPTPNDGRGGVWMSGTAPAVDENGNLYITTGNSLNENRTTNNYHTYNTTYATDPANRGEGVIKLNPDLTLSSWFTPYNYIALNQADKDFPIQVILLPNTNLAMTGCKDGNLYIMDKTNLGGINTTTSDNHNIVQSINIGGTMHSSFAYFGGAKPYAYQFSENTQLKAFPVTGAGLGTVVTNSTIAGPSGGSGGFLSVSSNGIDPSTGILWAYQAINGCNANNNNCHAVLHAVKATDITKEIWNSDMVTVDNIPIFNKFSCPTIALGKVFIAANTKHLYCYGLKTNTTCVTNVALSKPVTALTTFAGAASNVTDGDFTTGWASVAHDVDSIYIDLGSSYDICRIAITWQTIGIGKDFDLKVSDDGITWRRVSAIRGNTASYTEFNSGATGRYVNMVGIHRGTSNGYIINEFQVFGNPASACRTPSGLSASSTTPSTEHLSWDAVAGIDNYIIQYHSNLSESWITRTSGTNTIDLSALTCGTVYYYTIQADCGGSQSAVSKGSFQTADCTGSCDIFPVRYYSLDLGDIGVAGSTCKLGNVWNLTGSGTDIGGTDDQFQFAFTNNDIGDYEVSGRIIQQDVTNAANKFGIMVRDSLTNTSRFAFVASVNQGNNIIFEYRDIAGGPVTSIQVPGHYSLPYWFKINKSGTSYAPMISPDGVNWTPAFHQVDLNFGLDPTNIPNYGMAISSLNNGSISSGQIDNFTFAGSAPLPIRLISFTAKNINNDHVLVSWATSMEHLTDHFDIQRGTDNSSFGTIATVPAVGESEVTHNYSVTDNNPVAGINYYRLKETDKDGKSYISPVVSVKIDETQAIQVSPNPADNFTNIHTLKGWLVEVTLYDITGKLLQTIQPGNGNADLRLNTADLSKGVYFIKVKTNTGQFRQKLLKQ